MNRIPPVLPPLSAWLLTRLTGVLALAAVLSTFVPAQRLPAAITPAKPTSLGAKLDLDLPDRVHFVTLFAYGNHVFAAFTKARPLTSDLRDLSDPETYTISWLPKDGVADTRNRSETGQNFTLEETLRRARELRQKITMFGPYRVDASLYRKGLRQQDRLESGFVRFRRDLNDQRRLGAEFFGATAVADLETTLGLIEFGTTKVTGEKAARQILERWKSLIKKPSVAHAEVARLILPPSSLAEMKREAFPGTGASKSKSKP